MRHECKNGDRRQRGGSLQPLLLGLMLAAGLLGGGGAQRATACGATRQCVENIEAVLAVPIIVSADAGKCSASGLNPTPTNVPFSPGSFFAPGNTTVTPTATDAAGNAATCPFTVSVAYQWSGVLQPIDADGSSVFKAGRTVPVKFQLTGPSSCVTTLAATLSWTKQSSSVAGAVNQAGSTSTGTSGNEFRYDPKSGQYTFNWDTMGLTSGTYELQINMSDGVTHTVNVELR